MGVWRSPKGIAALQGELPKARGEFDDLKRVNLEGVDCRDALQAYYAQLLGRQCGYIVTVVVVSTNNHESGEIESLKVGKEADDLVESTEADFDDRRREGLHIFVGDHQVPCNAADVLGFVFEPMDEPNNVHGAATDELEVGATFDK